MDPDEIGPDLRPLVKLMYQLTPFGSPDSEQDVLKLSANTRLIWMSLSLMEISIPLQTHHTHSM